MCINETGGKVLLPPHYRELLRNVQDCFFAHADYQAPDDSVNVDEVAEMVAERLNTALAAYPEEAAEDIHKKMQQTLFMVGGAGNSGAALIQAFEKWAGITDDTRMADRIRMLSMTPPVKASQFAKKATQHKPDDWNELLVVLNGEDLDNLKCVVNSNEVYKYDAQEISGL